MPSSGVQLSPGAVRTVAIQGERGSNSHMAAVEMLGGVEILPCTLSSDVIDAVLTGRVDGAVLPIENSLHGSVAEHYDLLLEHPIRIDRESLLRIRHNLIAAPGVTLEFRPSGTLDVLDLLDRGGLELVIGLFAAPGERFSRLSLLQDDFVVVLPS